MFRAQPCRSRSSPTWRRCCQTAPSSRSARSRHHEHPSAPVVVAARPFQPAPEKKKWSHRDLLRHHLADRSGAYCPDRPIEKRRHVARAGLNCRVFIDRLGRVRGRRSQGRGEDGWKDRGANREATRAASRPSPLTGKDAPVSSLTRNRGARGLARSGGQTSVVIRATWRGLAHRSITPRSPVVRVALVPLFLCAVLPLVLLGALAVALILVVSIVAMAGLAVASLFSPRVRNTQRATIHVTRRRP